MLSPCLSLDGDLPWRVLRPICCRIPPTSSFSIMMMMWLVALLLTQFCISRRAKENMNAQGVVDDFTYHIWRLESLPTWRFPFSRGPCRTFARNNRIPSKPANLCVRYILLSRRPLSRYAYEDVDGIDIEFMERESLQDFENAKKIAICDWWRYRPKCRFSPLPHQEMGLVLPTTVEHFIPWGVELFAWNNYFRSKSGANGTRPLTSIALAPKTLSSKVWNYTIFQPDQKALLQTKSLSQKKWSKWWWRWIQQRFLTFEY